MARRNTTPRSRASLYSILCFAVLILTAVIWALTWILNLLEVGSRFVSILVLIKEISLWAAVSLGAYNWARKLGKAWFTVYVVLVILTLLCILFGNLGFFGSITI